MACKVPGGFNLVNIVSIIVAQTFQLSKKVKKDLLWRPPSINDFSVLVELKTVFPSFYKPDANYPTCSCIGQQDQIWIGIQPTEGAAGRAE